MNGIFATLKQWRGSAALAMLAAGLIPAYGCFGRFPVTHAVYKINASPGNKLVQTLVFWVFVIIPVYSIAMLVDAIVLNLIEFWTGDTVSVSSVEERDGVRVSMQSSPSGREVVMTISRDGELVSEHHITKNSQGALEVRDAAGNYVGRLVKAPGGASSGGAAVGGVQIIDVQGKIVQTPGSAPALAPQG